MLRGRQCSSDYPHATRIPLENGHLACPRCLADYLLVCSLAVYPIDARYATYKNLAKFRRGDERLIELHSSVSVQPIETCLSEKTSAYIRRPVV